MASENSGQTVNGSDESTVGPQISSHVPGRLRIRGISTSQVESVAKEIAGIDGVADVSFDQLLGSVLVKYDTIRIPPSIFSEKLRQIPLLSEIESETKSPGEPIIGSKRPPVASAKVKSTGLRLAARSIIPSVLLIFSLFEAIRSRAVPTWYDIIKETLDEFRYVSETDKKDDDLMGGIRAVLMYLNELVLSQTKGRLTLASLVIMLTFCWSFLEFIQRPIMAPWVHIFREGMAQIRHQGGLR